MAVLTDLTILAVSSFENSINTKNSTPKTQFLKLASSP